MNDESDLRSALSMLVASVEKLQWMMDGSKCSPEYLITKWDNRTPMFFYLERNLQWAKEVLAAKALL